MRHAVVIGAGPAGLAAADALSRAGLSVTLADAMPSPARKFLMAGKSGLNLTKDVPFPALLSAYGASADRLAPMLRVLDAPGVMRWAEALGQEVFTGSSGRVFPRAMKASPLVRALLSQLSAQGVTLKTRWRWLGWDGPSLRFDTPDGARTIAADVTVLALGGASWARLGSDGAWAAILRDADVPLCAFAPSNAGLHIDWAPPMARVFGQPLKNVALHVGELVERGECVVSARGIEGGGIYAVTPQIRAGHALRLDLKPDLDAEAVRLRLERPRGKDSLTNWLRKALRLDPVKIALLREFGAPLPEGPVLADLIKALPIRHQGLRPMDEAISTAGGVRWDGVDDSLMLKARPGVFVAGEMLDWDAPTGGYLLTACLATGAWAGQHAARYMENGDGTAIRPAG